MEKWSFRTPTGYLFTRQQLPLKLAWAVSIHKSQVLEKNSTSNSTLEQLLKSTICLSRTIALYIAMNKTVFLFYIKLGNVTRLCRSFFRTCI